MLRRDVLPPLIVPCMLEMNEAGVSEKGNELQVEDAAVGVSFCCRHNLTTFRARIREAWRALKGYHEVDIIVDHYSAWRVQKYLHRMDRERGGI